MLRVWRSLCFLVKCLPVTCEQRFRTVVLVRALLLMMTPKLPQLGGPRSLAITMLELVPRRQAVKHSIGAGMVLTLTML